MDMNYWNGDGVEGLGADTAAPTPSAWDTFITSVSSGIQKLAPAVAAVKTAQAATDIQKLNIQRAQQGLPPIDSSQMVPTAGVQVGINRDTQKLIMYGAIGLGAVVLMSVMLNKKRR